MTADARCCTNSIHETMDRSVQRTPAGDRDGNRIFLLDRPHRIARWTVQWQEAILR
jgi:hypothetical protein